jgi:Tfp pilus assembly protein PilF
MALGIRAVLYGQQPKPPRRSLVTMLGATVAARGVEAAVAQYRELKRASRSDYDFAEPRLNQIASMLLQRGRAADAIVLLKLNVEEYPRSASVHASLARAYEDAQQPELAKESYRAALAIEPSNQRLKDRLSALEGR